MREWIANHGADIELAIVLAVIFALVFALIVTVLFELFDVGTKIRSSRYIRRFRDKWSKRTIIQLRKQIAEKEKYRDTFVSDKAIYLRVFRIAWR